MMEQENIVREKVLIKSYHERFGDLLMGMWTRIRRCIVEKGGEGKILGDS